jgi:hypothetical protein
MHTNKHEFRNLGEHRQRDRKSAPSQITPDFWKKFIARNAISLTCLPFLKSLFRFLDPCGIYFIYRCRLVTSSGHAEENVGGSKTKTEPLLRRLLFPSSLPPLPAGKTSAKQTAANL